MRPYVMRALKAGARAYLLKDSAFTDLIRAIESVSQGKSYSARRSAAYLAED
jgi:DNA-binding NarL/FixJ family response regulator